MGELTIEQMNEVIAKFMGWEWYEDESGIWFKREGLIMSMHPNLKDLKYHLDWSWLMPVIEKISKIKLLNVDGTECTDIQDVCYPLTFNMPSPEGRPMFRFIGFSLHTADTLIEAAHAAVYEVAEWQKIER
jgi:hypothetical protein